MTAADDVTAGTAVGHVLDEPEAGGKAIRGAALRGGGFIAAALLSAISAPLLVRHLGVVDFGRYTTVVSLIAIVGGLTEGGLGAIGTREYAVLEGAARDRLMRNLLGMRIVLTAIGGLGAVLFAQLAGYGPELVAGTAVAAVALLITVVQGTYAVPQYATLVLGRQVAAELARQAFLVALIALLVLLGASIVPFLAAQIPPVIALLVATVIMIRGQMPLVPQFDVRYWRGLLRDTLPVAASSAIQTIYFRSVIIIMSLIATGTETGLFSTSYRVMEVLSGFPGLLIGTAFPILARAATGDRDRLAHGFGRLVDVAAIGGVWMVASTIIGAEVIMAAIGGAEAEPAVPVLRLQAITLMEAFYGAALGFALLSMRLHAQLMWSNGAALVVIVSGAFLLVPPYGAVGAAIATLAGEAVQGVMYTIFVLRSPHRLRLPVSVPAKVLVAALAGVAVAFLPVPDLVRVVLFSAVYFGVLGALGALPRELLDALRRR
jgi:O-antigen/teichoic acid export membrane protein